MLSSRWNPPADLYHTPEGWAIKLDLAGVRPEDVTLELVGRDLHISGSRRDLVLAEGWRHYSMEIEYNHFERVVRLPRELRNVLISSEFQDGMLLIRLKGMGEGSHG
ncbi:MAG TPA: Hsp20/alpha crystallin family protein [bacterium]|nr:Hsp20/alpha crystallin family protein [bacterium]